MDYVSLCKNFFEATNILISLTKDGNSLYSSLGEMLSFSSDYHRDLFDISLAQNPCFCGDSPDIEYGRIHVENTGYDIFLGPCFNIPVTDQIVRQFMRELSLPIRFHEQFSEILCSVPRISHVQFAHYLLFFHQLLNHKEGRIETLLSQDESLIQKNESRQLRNSLSAQEEGTAGNTYYFELELYQLIKEGDPEKLKRFLHADRLALQEGKMAQTPLRHSKNIFISTAVKAGILGAIPGGCDVEKTYLLVDYYIQECERLQTIDEIHQLQYVMIMDFCRRSGISQIPEGISRDVYQCMSYIRSHTNESISVEDAAAHVNRSSSYMMKHFKSELGIHMGAYMMRCKLEEAKSLLTHSEKSLAEISSYLCFSSQSYFQNVFKKQYGITPSQYRQKTKLIPSGTAPAGVKK
ncbi:MAG: AraC family transcriptional regulator [Eubacteriales bacterium]|nr:AraC family transcriptional regulator [Eubacteriales bacterium]